MGSTQPPLAPPSGDFYRITLDPNRQVNRPQYANVPLQKIRIWIARHAGYSYMLNAQPLDIPIHIIEDFADEDTINMADLVEKGVIRVENSTALGVYLTPIEVKHIGFIDVNVVQSVPVPTA